MPSSLHVRSGPTVADEWPAKAVQDIIHHKSYAERFRAYDGGVWRALILAPRLRGCHPAAGRTQTNIATSSQKIGQRSISMLVELLSFSCQADVCVEGGCDRRLRSLQGDQGDADHAQPKLDQASRSFEGTGAFRTVAPPGLPSRHRRLTGEVPLSATKFQGVQSFPSGAQQSLIGDDTPMVRN